MSEATEKPLITPELRRSFDYEFERAEGLGIKVPDLAITDQLVTRLARRSRELVVTNPQALVQGAIDLEIERDIDVVILSTPTHSAEYITEEVDATYEHRYMSRSADMHITVDPEKVLKDKEADKRTNGMLWLGVIVANRLAEGQKDHYEDEMKERIKAQRGLGFLAGAAAGLSDEFMSLVDLAHITAATQAASLGAQLCIDVATGLITKHKKETAQVHDFMEHEFAEQATELAQKHPVLSFEPIFNY